MEQIRNYLETEKNEMLRLLESIVNIDSGSYCKEGIDACARILSQELRNLSFQAEVISEINCGNHVRAERSANGTKRLFLSAHLDTVWPSGAAANHPFRRDGDILYGAGIGDMKGGIVQMIYALKALHELGLETPPISVFLTGDEELGSLRGRPYIEQEASRSDWVLVMESSSDPDVIVVERWGVGAFYLKISGKGAHVMDAKAAGVNACRELALKILALEGLSDPLEGIKVSVNLVQGGASRQMTAPAANADIDVRIRDLVQMGPVEERVRQIAGTPFLPGVRVGIEGGMTRPPMQVNGKTEAFLNLVKDIGREIGMEIRPGSKPGGSDGCFTSALGIATLDGVGPVCHDLYSDRENVEVNSLMTRTLLTAMTIQRLSGARDQKR
jgi:glutamate carboxypeptidase